MKKGFATVAQLDEFDEIIDARSPAEFAEDHIGEARNYPALDNEQRIIVGTIFKQRSAFEARRIGAAMVAENIARHLVAHLQDKPKNWRPLIYCWRGGQRSGSFVTWLRMIGWDACQLEGGYKAYRRRVVAELEVLPARFEFRVLCGPTGSAKTRILEAMAQRGAQTLDLEDLAAHKGSVLGALPDRAQPTQKRFETRLFEKLWAFNPEQPVYVEAESRKIGRIQLPDALIGCMREAACIAIDAEREARLDFLVRDYAYLADDVEQLSERIDNLRNLQSRETIERWKALARERALRELYAEFIDRHYDPLYHRSQNRNFVRFNEGLSFATDDLGQDGIAALADRILTSGGGPS